MKLEDVLGITKTNVINDYAQNIVASNNVNNTIELNCVTCSFLPKENHIICYYDLVDNDTMIMAILKAEGTTKINKTKFKQFTSKYCVGFSTSITTYEKDISICWIRENIVKAL